MSGSSGFACLTANQLWAISLRRSHAAYRAALNDPAGAQRRILAGILERNASTQFGREMHFEGIRTTEQFRDRVPLSTYEDYAGHIERIKFGERGVLTAEHVGRLVPSSGSVAARKLIPYTRSLHDEFQRGIGPWIADLFARNPELKAGPAYWSISPAMPEGDAESAVPIGFDDDSAYLGAFSRRLVRLALAVPSGVRQIQDVDDFRFATMLFLLRTPELRIVSVWHPSFFDLLCRFMVDRWSELLRAIGEGLSVRGLAPDEAGMIARSDRMRARALEGADPELPATIWPRLGHISCWTDGQASGAASTLAARFPNTPLVGKGLVATEAIVSIPFEGARPLAVTSHFLEFVDATGNVSGIDALRQGEMYSVVVTTSGGLYRYRLDDLVRVEGFVGKTPSIAFIGKGDSISDTVGEKLSDGFVATVLARLFADSEGRPAFSLVAPERMEGSVHYTLFLSEPFQSPDILAERLDRELSANPHYAYARSLGQLHAAEVCRVSSRAHEIVLSELSRRGRVMGGVKAMSLSADLDWRAKLTDRRP